MRNITIVAIFILLFGSCKTIKQSTKETTQTDISSRQVKIDNSKEELLEKVNRLLENSKSSSFESNLNLIPSENSGVVRYVEVREGKPYREIEIQGGSLQEKKQVRDTIYIRDTTSFQRNIQKFRELTDSLQVQIKQLQEKELRTERKANGWGFSGWLIAIIVILLTLLFMRWRFKLF